MAAVLGPFLVGSLADVYTYVILFPFSAIAMIVAFFFILFVRTGEAGEVDKSAYLDVLE